MRYSEQIQQLYYDKLRQMTGEERMKFAFDMCNFAMSLAKANIQNLFSNISEKEQKVKTKEMYDILTENQECVEKIFLLELWQKIQKQGFVTK